MRSPCIAIIDGNPQEDIFDLMKVGVVLRKGRPVVKNQ